MLDTDQSAILQLKSVTAPGDGVASKTRNPNRDSHQIPQR
jgi:hypothetical protein